MNGSDMLAIAVEGGINYWAHVVSYDDLRATVLDAEDEGSKSVTVTAADMARAAKTVCAMYPNTRGAGYIRQDNIDAEAADMIFQVAAFGDIIYG